MSTDEFFYQNQAHTDDMPCSVLRHPECMYLPCFCSAVNCTWSTAEWHSAVL